MNSVVAWSQETEGRLVTSISLAVKIKLVDHDRTDTLVLLSQVVEKAIATVGE